MRTIYTALCTCTLNTSKHFTSTHCTIVHYIVGCTLKFTVPNTVMHCTSSRLQPLVVTPWLSPGCQSIVSRGQAALSSASRIKVETFEALVQYGYYYTAQLYCTLHVIPQSYSQDPGDQSPHLPEISHWGRAWLLLPLGPSSHSHDWATSNLIQDV